MSDYVESDTKRYGLPTARSHLSDSGAHAVKHELLDVAIERFDKKLDRIAESAYATREDIVIIKAELPHLASRDDMSQALRDCQAQHRPIRNSIAPGGQPDWKALGAMISVVVAAVAALALGIVNALN